MIPRYVYTYVYIHVACTHFLTCITFLHWVKWSQGSTARHDNTVISYHNGPAAKEISAHMHTVARRDFNNSRFFSLLSIIAKFRHLAERGHSAAYRGKLLIIPRQVLERDSVSKDSATCSEEARQRVQSREPLSNIHSLQACTEWSDCVFCTYTTDCGKLDYHA